MIADGNDTAVDADPLPSGTVTFVFTDLVGSTRLWQEHADLATIHAFTGDRPLTGKGRFALGRALLGRGRVREHVVGAVEDAAHDGDAK